VTKKKAGMMKDFGLWNQILSFFTGCVLEENGAASGLMKFKCDKSNRFKVLKTEEAAETKSLIDRAKEAKEFYDSVKEIKEGVADI